ncbi:protein of unknown function [Candidatus Filomicrobium marinum]|uniref:Uncharacterized protein n=1 Tax=Candidatus Filomicrobium marinum TaxID=1608628 RepID=A0A0D6JGI7_9HYPH|nr:protein of unknown function [Candidatus Filomicrobium marinum]CPR19666.1 protein of unknown function [Candidatus Filomicrobium marinum]
MLISNVIFLISSFGTRLAERLTSFGGRIPDEQQRWSVVHDNKEPRQSLRSKPGSTSRQRL